MLKGIYAVLGKGGVIVETDIDTKIDRADEMVSMHLRVIKDFETRNKRLKKENEMLKKLLDASERHRIKLLDKERR